MGRKIVDAKKGLDGRISQVKLEGNKNYTSVDKAIEMTEKGLIEAVTVTQNDGSKHIRSPGNGSTNDNLGTMADNNKDQ